MINQESKHPVTIEDLLRLKRTERPAASFWTEFDRELREKQLAALVAKRPWWRTFPGTLRGLARYHLPLGATAVLAITLLSIRDYQPVLPNPNASLPEYDGATRALTPDNDIAATTSVTADEQNEISQAASAAEASKTSLALSSEANAPGELSRLVPMLTADDAAARVDRPSARSIAENRAVAEAMLGTTNSGFETRALPVRVTPTEPLAQMSFPSETRRSRFAVAFAAAAIGTSPAPTARVARRLSDEQLYDTIHRFGASGNSVSFRF